VDVALELVDCVRCFAQGAKRPCASHGPATPRAGKLGCKRVRVPRHGKWCEGYETSLTYTKLI
jgi:hypothetical protein